MSKLRIRNGVIIEKGQSVVIADPDAFARDSELSPKRVEEFRNVPSDHVIVFMGRSNISDDEIILGRRPRNATTVDIGTIQLVPHRVRTALEVG